MNHFLLSVTFVQNLLDNFFSRFMQCSLAQTTKLRSGKNMFTCTYFVDFGTILSPTPNIIHYICIITVQYIIMSYDLGVLVLI